MGFLVDKGGGLPPIRGQRAAEQEQPDTRTELEKERDWNRKTAIAVGIVGALPWVSLGLLRLLACVPFAVEQKKNESLKGRFQ